MKLEFTQSMKVAQKVLRAVNAYSLPKEIVKRSYVDAYSNGREQGFCIHGYFEGESVVISFAENRNSDNIVVYVGRNNDLFFMQGNVPSEDAYKCKGCFAERDKALCAS